MISSQVYDFTFADGLNQKVQKVTLDSFNQLQFLQPKYDPNSFEAICHLYSQFFIQKFSFICGWLIVYTISDDIVLPQSFYHDGNSTFFDKLSCLNKRFRQTIKLKNDRLIFADQEVEALFNQLLDNKQLQIIKGQRKSLTFLPVSDHFGYLSSHLDDYQLLVNSHFFVMLHFDCDSCFDSVSTPVGLMVKDGNILSPNLYDRECLLVKNNKVSIEKISLSQLKIEIDGQVYQDKLNCQLCQRDKYRRTKKGGFDLIVVNDKVLACRKNGGSEVPESGYVIKLDKEISLKDNTVRYHGLEDVSFGISVGNSTVINGVVTDKFISPFHKMLKPFENAFVPAVYPTNFAKDRAPRIVLGADKDGKPLLLWFEGAGKYGYDKQRDSCGASLKEVGDVCQKLGMYNGINLDGGGSAQILLHKKRCLKISDRNSTTFLEEERAIPIGLAVK
ncbi:MAG: phosphodiester glycosidase family protein [Erysipelotrichaceae bacterium]